MLPFSPSSLPVLVNAFTTPRRWRTRTIHAVAALNPTNGVESQLALRMRELEVRTSRVRRGWMDRLKGYARLYETKVTDGERAAYGRGASREASEQAALRNWNAKFNDFDTREPE
jgi:hypothetical protein